MSGGCHHRRGANEYLESGQLVTNDEIMTNGECIEMATIQDDSGSSRMYKQTNSSRTVQSKHL